MLLQEIVNIILHFLQLGVPLYYAYLGNMYQKPVHAALS